MINPLLQGFFFYLYDKNNLKFISNNWNNSLKFFLAIINHFMGSDKRHT